MIYTIDNKRLIEKNEKKSRRKTIAQDVVDRRDL